MLGNIFFGLLNLTIRLFLLLFFMTAGRVRDLTSLWHIFPITISFQTRTCFSSSKKFVTRCICIEYSKGTLQQHQYQFSTDHTHYSVADTQTPTNGNPGNLLPTRFVFRIVVSFLGLPGCNDPNILTFIVAIHTMLGTRCRAQVFLYSSVRTKKL